MITCSKGAHWWKPALNLFSYFFFLLFSVLHGAMGRGDEIDLAAGLCFQSIAVPRKSFDKSATIQSIRID